MMFKFFKITCGEATKICDKSQYGEASFIEKIKHRIHFLQCKFCKMYSKQNTFLSILFRKKAIECGKEKSFLTDEEKTLLKEKLKENTI